MAMQASQECSAITGVIAFEIHDGVVTGVRAMLNPEKLTRVTGLAEGA
jgi:hypothetical protein